MTLTKEWLQQTISELENERDAIPGAVNEDAAMALAAMKMALASLTAEPVAFVMADDLNDRSIISTPAYRQLDEARERTVGDVVALYTAPPSPVVPDENGLLPCPFCGSPAEHYPDGDMEGYSVMCGHKNGDCNSWIFGFSTPEEAERSWNTRAAMLQGAEPVSDVEALSALIEGMEVSVDVSTCDADVGRRYFGTVTELSELDGAKNGYILLVQDAEPNFVPAGNSPAIPDGYALVPVEPTAEMQSAAASAIRFETTPINKLWTGNAVYKAMLAAVPQLGR